MKHPLQDIIDAIKDTGAAAVYFHPVPGAEPPRTVYTPPQAAKVLGISPESIIALIRSGALKGSNISNGSERPRYRVTQSAIDRYLESRQVESPRKTSKVSPARRTPSPKNYRS